jgi:beta-lactamase superfamily II metal-dependent hydrolase
MFKHINQTPFVYIEKVHQDSILLDFVESGAFISFLESIGSASNGKTFEDPSMILINNYRQKKVQEGVTYSLNSEAIQKILRDNRINQYQQNSFIIGFQIDLKKDDDELLGKSKSFTEIERSQLRLEQFSNHAIPEIETKGETKVLVRNVGQGSWNEIVINNRTKLIFDIGTHYLTKRTDIQEMLKDKEEIFLTDKPGIIISHWDIDHYHYLIGLSDEALKSISFFCARNYLPTMTSRMIYFKIERLIGNNHMFPIEPFPKPKKSLGYAQLQRINPIAQNIIYYNSSLHRNRNQNAICVAIRKSQSSIVFPADTHYSQISNCILPDLGFKNNHYLVVPHHGGNAGKFEYNLKNNSNPQSAIVSVGKNSYGHPIKEHLQNLRDFGFRVLQTNNLKKDIEVILN